MIPTAIMTVKKDVFYYRVSTMQQSLEMQMSASERFRKELAPSEYVVLTELGYSANKLSIDKRPVLQELMDMIKANQIRTIYLYDRSRLARNFYEYMMILSLLYQYNVELVFTTTESSYQTFSEDLMIEGLYAIIADEEGRNISRRIEDFHSLTPNKKYGYLVDKASKGYQYGKNPMLREDIHTLFDEVKSINSHQAFLIFLNKATRLTRKPALHILQMIQDSFYAAHSKRGEIYTVLEYVEPYISLEEHKQIQLQLSSIINVVLREVNDSHLDNFHPPYCGECENQMEFKAAKAQKESYYICSKSNHERISVKAYNEQILTIAMKILTHLNIHELEKKVLQELVNKKDELRFQQDSLYQQNRKMQYEVVELTDKTEISVHAETLEEIQRQLFTLEKQLIEYELYEKHIHHIVDLYHVPEFKKRKDLIGLTHFFIGNVFLDKEVLDIEIFYSSYLDMDKLVKELYRY